MSRWCVSGRIPRAEAVFVDTSAWYDPSDSTYMPRGWRGEDAADQHRPLVSTNHVLGETYTLVRRRPGNCQGLAFLQRTREDPLVQRVFVPEVWEEEAERLLAQYDDQPFSYVDATSFVAMRRMGIQEALTFDGDFRIVGFLLVGDE